MSLVSTHLAAGLARHFDAAGESLSFRGMQLLGSVDRRPNVPIGSGELRLAGPVDGSRVLLPLAAIDPLPAVGEEFKDSAGSYHRVQSLRRLGNAVECECSVSESTTA